MSRNERVFTRIENCLDELVDCFEELVKKSVFVVSVAVGTLVLMVMYVIKTMTDRATHRQIGDLATENHVFNAVPTVELIDKSSQVSTLRGRENTSCPCVSAPTLGDFEVWAVETKSTSVQDIPNSYPGFKDDFMKETELGMNIISHGLTKQTQVSDDLKEARINSKPVPTMLPCLSKSSSYECLQDQEPTPPLHSKIDTPSSCCSMCCEGDRTGQWTR